MVTLLKLLLCTNVLSNMILCNKKPHEVGPYGVYI